MRVLMMTRWYPPPVGGIAVHVAAIGAAMARRHVDVTILTAEDQGIDHRPDAPSGPRVVRVPAGGPVMDGPSDFAEILGDAHLNSSLASVAASLRPFDVVHSQGSRTIPAGVAAASRFGCPFVFTKHRLGGGHLVDDRHADTDRQFRREFYADRLEAWGARRASRVVAVSEAAADELVDVMGLPPEKCSVIPNGTELAGSDRLREPFDGSPKLLFVGRFVADKGADQAIRALAGLRDADATLTIAGGDDATSLRGLATDLGVVERVHFVGEVPNDAIGPLYESSDVVLIPSRREAGPIALVEAQAAGRLVVATAVGGIKERIEHMVTGLVATPGSVAELSALVQWAIDNPVDARRIARRAAVNSRSATWDEAARKTIEIYRAAVGERSRPCVR